MTTGGCFCGSIRYAVDGAPLFLCICHCASCRRATGAPAVPWGTFLESGFRITQGEIARHESSPGVTRGFCNRCGTALTYTQTRRPGEIDVTLATLDDPEAYPPTLHIWVQDKLSWTSIADHLPQWPATPPTTQGV